MKKRMTIIWLINERLAKKESSIGFQNSSRYVPINAQVKKSHRV